MFAVGLYPLVEFAAYVTVHCFICGSVRHEVCCKMKNVAKFETSYLRKLCKTYVVCIIF